MKMQNVYIGQLFDIRYGAVYSSVHEAVKEICRPQQAGMVFTVTFLPDADHYWIAGAVGEHVNLRHNLIFDNQDKASKHAENLIARGYPKRDIVFRELKINTKGPDNIDIKTEDHYICERQLTELRRALEIGIPVSNIQAVAAIVYEDGSVRLEKSNHIIIDTEVAGFNEMDSAALWDNVKTAGKLLKEMASVDQEKQPNKWAKLQKAAAEFGTTHDMVDPTEDEANG